MADLGRDGYDPDQVLQGFIAPSQPGENGGPIQMVGRTVRYEDEAIKKRVISLLKIRCEMSQDPIICEVLTKLKGS